jgi:putative IMPACT (imprinted ancient) family translation regulator
MKKVGTVGGGKPMFEHEGISVYTVDPSRFNCLGKVVNGLSEAEKFIEAYRRTHRVPTGIDPNGEAYWSF